MPLILNLCDKQTWRSSSSIRQPKPLKGTKEQEPTVKKMFLKQTLCYSTREWLCGVRYLMSKHQPKSTQQIRT